MARKKADSAAAPAATKKGKAATHSVVATVSGEDYYKMRYHQAQQQVKQLERELAEQKKQTKAAESRARRARGAFENAMRTMERLRSLIEME